MGTEGDSGDAGDLGRGDGGVAVNIRSSNGSKFSVRARLDSTVGLFKALLEQNCNIPAQQQRLIYKGRILKDDQTLESYGLQTDHTVHLIRGLPSPPENATGGAYNGATNVSPGSARGVGPNEGGGFGTSLFPGLSVGDLGGNGTPGLFGDGLSEFEQVNQQLTQNPSIMREMMNMPVIQNLMNNPDVMRNLIMSNPQMQEIVDRNPELAHILNDPSILRQTLEAARNPELMREMMRNTDRAMSNIEATPEGFNMLRRMYETVQEPLMNATTMSGDNGNDSNSNLFASLFSNQGGSETRNQSSNASTTTSEASVGSAAPNTNPLPNPWSSTGGRRGTQTNVQSNPVGDTGVPGNGGLSGLGIPNMEQLLSGMQDSSQFNQFMQSPAVSQLMQNFMSDPQYMNQILGMDSHLRSILDSNPQIREMMQNPEFLRQLTSPETVQQLSALQQSLFSLLPQRTTQESGQTGTGAGAATMNNMGLEMLMNMFGGLGAGSPGVPNTMPPEQLYATQLSQLQEMGFIDTQENIRALSATFGNVNAAIERLLGNPGL
ncbi:hypothetical protein Syun_005600 [Stephania yunnanensis]|uniref:Uncharacterized protein n=1 Tax=Stephania yunnanensis TaxID=152371 RepID=A0AAP0L529_9MAGN